MWRLYLVPFLSFYITNAMIDSSTEDFIEIIQGPDTSIKTMVNKEVFDKTWHQLTVIAKKSDAADIVPVLRALYSGENCSKLQDKLNSIQSCGFEIDLLNVHPDEKKIVFAATRISPWVITNPSDPKERIQYFFPTYFLDCTNN